jgi:hypothetical protein
MTEGRKPLPAPKGLSAVSRTNWRRFTEEYGDWSLAELFTLEKFLRMEDLAEEQQAEGDLTAANQARVIGWRYFRSLKFSSASGSKRIGRRPDAGWSPARAAGGGNHAG